MGGLVQINPVWLYGPYNPSQVTAGSQPDWYIGWLEGTLRLMPSWETTLLGHTLSWNVFIPAVVVPGLVFTVLGLYPFIEAWVTGDKREHNILDRPRNQPVRTGLGAMAITFYLVMLLAGGNDIIAHQFDLDIFALIWTFRIAAIVLPPLAFVVTKRICIGLQRRDREKLLHGRETGIIKRLPNGEFIEVHEPVSAEEAHVLAAGEERRPLELPPAEDPNGVVRKGARIDAVRAKFSRWYFADNVPTPTPEELAHAHAPDGHGQLEQPARPELPSSDGTAATRGATGSGSTRADV